MTRFWLALATALLALPALGQPDEFSARYPSAGEGMTAGSNYRPTLSDGDVWRLSALALDLGPRLTVEVGPCAIVIGAVDGNALWGCVIADDAPTLHSTLAGDGETVANLSFTFHPSRFADVVPPASVQGPGPASALAMAQRVYSAKMPTTFGQGDAVKLQPESYIVVDVDTTRPARRLFAVDLAAGAIRYVNQVENLYVAPPEPLTPEQASAAFDEVWQAYDTEYAMFVIKPEVDWAALRDEYRPLAENATDSFGLATVFAEMLGHLKDPHAWVVLGESEYLPVYNPPRPLNANPQAIGRLIPDTGEPVGGLAYGRTADGIGYVAVLGLSGDDLPQRFDAALEDLRDTTALILDIRFNGGGNEVLAQHMAGRLVDEPRVYAGQRFRAGAAHDALTEPSWRTLDPIGPWRYDKPVVVLWGRRTMSSAEGFALMLKQCPQVTTMGDLTAGASGNPRFIELPGSVRVSVPRWLALDADGNTFEGVGIAPDVIVNAGPEDFTPTSDPVLEAALERLRHR